MKQETKLYSLNHKIPPKRSLKGDGKKPLLLLLKPSKPNTQPQFHCGGH